MDSTKITELANELYDCLQSLKTLDPLSEREPDMTIEDAYKVSLNIMEKRLAAGEKVVGKKIGLTSKVVQDMLGVHQPDFGFMMDSMHYPSGAEIDLDTTLIQPKAEGEIAFVLKEDLNGPGVTPEDVLAATKGVTPCFEIVDSRVKDWKIKIQDTVADNASCGVYVLGEELTDPNTIDFENCKMVLTNKGENIAEGVGSAALGSPLNCVAWLANTLGEYGISLNAGDVILSGSLAAMLPVNKGDDFEVSIEGMGSCSIKFK